jgi:PIN domain nuclease of toxin-antitoxin system
VVSFWEILIKHHLGRLPLPEAPAAYIPRQRGRHRISSLALREEAVAHLPKLPPLHRDPFDRILVCQAIEHNLALVTGDPVVRSYPVRTLWA